MSSEDRAQAARRAIRKPKLGAKVPGRMDAASSRRRSVQGVGRHQARHYDPVTGRKVQR